MVEAPHTRIARLSAFFLLPLALAACEGTGLGSAEPTLEPGLFAPTRDGPEGAPPGTCWGRTFTPAVIETVREQVEVTPAKVNPDGTIASLPVYRTEEKQRIVKQRQDTWFETLCDEQLTEEFVASLQRALQARGQYRGIISGVLDEQTMGAVRAYQRNNGGPDSGVLTLSTARELGLIASPLTD